MTEIFTSDCPLPPPINPEYSLLLTSNTSSYQHHHDAPDDVTSHRSKMYPTSKDGDDTGSAPGGQVSQSHSLHAYLSPKILSPYSKSKRRQQQQALNHATKAKEALMAAIEGKAVRNADNHHGEDDETRRARAHRDIRQVLDAQKQHRQDEHRRLIDFLQRPTAPRPIPLRQESSLISPCNSDNASVTGIISPMQNDEDSKAVVTMDANHQLDPRGQLRRLIQSEFEVGSALSDNTIGCEDVLNQSSVREAHGMVADSFAMPLTTEGQHHASRHPLQRNLQRRTEAQKVAAKEAHMALKGLNKQKRMVLIRQASHTAIAKHAARQALQVEMRQQHQHRVKREQHVGQQSSSLSGEDNSPATTQRTPLSRRHSEIRVLMMQQAVKEAILRVHSHENMARVAQELLSGAARKNWKRQACIQLQALVRGYLSRKRGNWRRHNQAPAVALGKAKCTQGELKAQ